MTSIENDTGSEFMAPQEYELEKVHIRQAQFRNVSVEVSAWIGKTKLTFGELSDLRPGRVIELDQPVGAPIEIVLNREVVLARGEVVEVGDEYGIRITEIVSDKDL